jgi:hypothetical protein
VLGWHIWEKEEVVEVEDTEAIEEVSLVISKKL